MCENVKITTDVAIISKTIVDTISIDRSKETMSLVELLIIQWVTDNVSDSEFRCGISIDEMLTAVADVSANISYEMAMEYEASLLKYWTDDNKHIDPQIPNLGIVDLVKLYNKIEKAVISIPPRLFPIVKSWLETAAKMTKDKISSSEVRT